MNVSKKRQEPQPKGAMLQSRTRRRIFRSELALIPTRPGTRSHKLEGLRIEKHELMLTGRAVVLQHRRVRVTVWFCLGLGLYV